MENVQDGVNALLFTILLVAVICGGIGGMCAERRGRGSAGFFLGFMLGPLGIVLALFLPRDGSGEPVRNPGTPVARVRRPPVKADPLEEFEARERAKTVLPVPVHLRGRTIDEE